MKVLVLTSEAVNAEMLRAALGDDAQDAEVMVVSPALQDSSVRFWVSDPDDAIAAAQEVADETLERLKEEGVDAVADTGESDPVLAVQDALATFEAQRIVVFRHAGDEGAYREEQVAEVEQRFGIPVVHGTVER